MENTYLSTLSSKGQLTVPKEVRKILKFASGQIMMMQIVSEGLVLKKAHIQPEDEAFSEEEWESLKQLSLKKGKHYKNGKKLLASLK